MVTRGSSVFLSSPRLTSLQERYFVTEERGRESRVIPSPFSTVESVNSVLGQLIYGLVRRLFHSAVVIGIATFLFTQPEYANTYQKRQQT